MFRLWRLCFLVGVLVFTVQGQDGGNPEDDTEVSLPAHDFTAEEGEDGVGSHREDEDASEDEGEEVTEEDLKSVWEDEHLSSEAIVTLHKKMDANSDGKVSEEELDAFSKASKKDIMKKEAGTVLEEIDLDKDGKVSLEELLEANFGMEHEDMKMAEDEEDKANEESRKREKELETEKFKLADVNKDGSLDKDELASVFYPEVDHKILELVAKHTLRKKDKDGDGVLSHAEFFSDQVVDEDLDEHDSRYKDQQQMNKDDFAKLDLDQDGKLTVKEILTWESGAYHMDDAMKQFFHIADDNEDKHITQDELNKAREPLANSPASGHLSQWAEHYGLTSKQEL